MGIPDTENHMAATENDDEVWEGVPCDRCGEHLDRVGRCRTCHPRRERGHLSTAHVDVASAADLFVVLDSLKGNQS